MTPPPRRHARTVIAALRRALTGRRNTAPAAPTPPASTTPRRRTPRRNPRPDGLCAFGHALAATSPPAEHEQLHDSADTTTT